MRGCTQTPHHAHAPRQTRAVHTTYHLLLAKGLARAVLLGAAASLRGIAAEHGVVVLGALAASEHDLRDYKEGDRRSTEAAEDGGPGHGFHCGMPNGIELLLVGVRPRGRKRETLASTAA